MNLLFICNQNRYRSPTAEMIINQGEKHKAKSAGLFCEDPKKLVNREHIDWADIIFIMEEYQREELQKKFPRQAFNKRILSLEIPDIYRYNQPELVDALIKSIGKYRDFLRE